MSVEILNSEILNLFSLVLLGETAVSWLLDRGWEFDIFISHGGEKKDMAFRIRRKFEDVKLKAFVDQADLPPGVKADTQMLMAVSKAPIGLALICEDYLRKPWPIRELIIIEERGTLLPVLYKIEYEKAKEALHAASPYSDLPEAKWQAFMENVVRTTALANPSTGKDEEVFVQSIVYAAVGFFISKAEAIAEQGRNNPVLAHRAHVVLKKLETAAASLDSKTSFGKLTVDQVEEAKQWREQVSHHIWELQKVL